MNKEQTKNLAKYSYDISKICFATIVIGQIIQPDGFRSWVFCTGVISTILFLMFGYFIDRRIKT